MNATPDTRRDLLASRYRLISRLADDLAHEIKNPLHAMVINLEVLRRRVTAGDPDIALERAAVIDQEIQRTHQLVDLLLKLLRPERQRDQHAYSLSGALEEILPLLRLQAKLALVPLEAEDTDIDAPIGVPAPDLKFALLALAMPMIDALKTPRGSGDPSPLRLSVAHETAVRIRLQSEQEALPDAGARRVARRFLEAGGGRVETRRAQSSIYIVLPRVTGA
ncbi:MAG: hypothetical protein GX539_13350 [Candidatus Cloacimonetes bacterium]|nr:hypothetical protein [Candidatus Cloacimonadota bacterium]